MPDSVRFIILLVGLCLFLVLLVIAFLLNRNRDLRSCLPVLLGAVLLFVVVVYVVDPEKLYECRYTFPDQIILAGHLSNPDPNNHLVILYKGDEEITRSTTGNGRFALDKVEESRDGYFELTVPNELGLNRCSMSMDFNQDRSGYEIFGLGQKTVSIWHHFAGLEAGATQTLNNEQPRKTYTLVVLPKKVNQYPQEIKEYLTYLDRDRNVAINLPIKTYTYVWDSWDTDITEFSTYAGRLSNSPPATLSLSVASDVRDAWVVAGSTYDTTSPNQLEPQLIDRDNCTGSLPPKDPVRIRSMYIREVQFQENAGLNFNLATAVQKAVPSLGFTQGQISTIDIPVSFDVPVGIHRKFKVHWQDVWRAGSMEVDFGGSKIQVPFRARIGLNWTLESFDVACPG